MRIGAIEAGGTKFVCGIGNEHGTIEHRVRIPTTLPDETIGRVVDYFRGQSIAAIGIGTFGPIDPDPSSAGFGSITTTPKLGWSHFPFVQTIKQHFDAPIGFDSDVNAAALGEATWGAARTEASCIYITIGTGIGAGIYIDGSLVHGLLHPEVGHTLVKRHPDDHFPGCCPFHGDCLEGLASGPAIEQRWSSKGSDLESEHPAWGIEAYYIAQAIVNAVLFVSPKKVIIGGGVMHQQQLFPLIRHEVKRLLNGYISHEALRTGIDSYIVAPGLGDNAGICGAVALGLAAYKGAAIRS